MRINVGPSARWASSAFTAMKPSFSYSNASMPQGLDATVEEQIHLPLISACCTINLTNTSKRSEELAEASRSARLIKK
jgi:hypothetical protein